MSRKLENQGFTCLHCGALVAPQSNGSYRNHCPFCLHSLHVDNTPGDRASQCHGLMEPIGIQYHSKKGMQIQHRCKKCGFTRTNIVVENGTQPDDFNQLLALMQNQAFYQ